MAQKYILKYYFSNLFFFILLLEIVFIIYIKIHIFPYLSLLYMDKDEVIKSRTLGFAQSCSFTDFVCESRTNPFGISCSEEIKSLILFVFIIDMISINYNFI